MSARSLPTDRTLVARWLLTSHTHIHTLFLFKFNLLAMPYDGERLL